MKVLVLYRPNSEYGRIVEEFIHDFQRRYEREHIEVLNIDSRDGSATASLYDVMQHPPILVLANDGVIQRCWMGSSLPRLDDVVSYARV